MSPRWQSRALTVAWIAIAVAAAECITSVTVALALPGPAVWDAFGQGSYLGFPPGRFLADMVPWLAMLLALGALAIARGDVRTPGGPWGRLALSHLPLLLTPFVLAEDDVARRPALLATLLASTVALSWWALPAGDRDDDGDSWRAHAPMLAVMALHAGVFTFLATQRDRALWSATVDLGIFKEALWNTLHGRVMHSPAVGYSFFGEHFSPVLFLLVPLYAVWPTSACLLTVQTLAITAAAWPVYRIARSQGVGATLATVLAGAMLFTPSMQTALLYDFHMDLLAVPAMTWLAWSLHRRAWLASVAALAVMVSVKEDMFIPAGAVLLAFFVTAENRSERRRVAAMAVATLVYCGLAMAVFMKHFGPPPGVPVYMSDGSATGGYKFFRNFRHLMGWGGPLRVLLGQPVRFGLYAFTGPRLTTLVSFVLPLAGMSLLAGRRLVLLAPLGIILLSDNPEIVSLRYHYSAIQHPGVYLAAVFGVAGLLGRVTDRARTERSLTLYVLLASLVMLVTHPSSMASAIHNTDTRAVTPHVAAVDRLVALVPRDAPVAVSTWIGPRVSNRPYSIHFPFGLDRAEWAVVDLQRPPWPAGPEQRDGLIAQLLRSGWGAVRWEDGAIAMHRGGDARQNLTAIRDLFARRRYEVEGTEQTEFPNCAVRDARASDGWARVVRRGDPRPQGFLVFGPFLRLPPGRYQVTFRLMVTGAHEGEPIGQVDVFVAPGVAIAVRELTPEMFPDASWRDVTVPFTVDNPQGAGAVEFRVRTTRRATVGADVITLGVTDGEDDVVHAMARF